MRSLLSLFMLFTALIVATCNYVPPFSRLIPNQPISPTFPRFRRSPEDKNKITANANKEGGKSTYQIEYERKLYENKHGSIGANVGVNKNPYSKPQSHVGVGGSFSW